MELHKNARIWGFWVIYAITRWGFCPPGEDERGKARREGGVRGVGRGVSRDLGFNYRNGDKCTKNYFWYTGHVI